MSTPTTKIEKHEIIELSSKGKNSHPYENLKEYNYKSADGKKAEIIKCINIKEPTNSYYKIILYFSAQTEHEFEENSLQEALEICNRLSIPIVNEFLTSKGYSEVPFVPVSIYKKTILDLLREGAADNDSDDQ